MKVIENGCVGCTSLGLHCLGSSCPYRNIIHYHCDKCGEEEKLYHYDGYELCADCLLKEVEIVEGSE